MNQSKSFIGLLSALAAYLIWAFNVFYFKALKGIPPFEILMHRMIWSFVLLIVLVLLFKRRKTFMAALTHRRTLLILLGSTLLVGFNWFIYIWSINNDRILDASLGYFICPLVNIVLGAVILHERLRRLQWIAVSVSAAAVLYLTFYYGEFPWVALSLAISFGLYGLIRKTAPVESIEGLTIETLLMFFPAAVYLFWLDQQGAGTFLCVDLTTDLLLMAASLMTAVPLLLFTFGARRLNLTTIGFLQYTAPSCTFLLAVFYYHEPFVAARGWSFAAIWTALALYSYDAVYHYRQVQRALKTGSRL